MLTLLVMRNNTNISKKTFIVAGGLEEEVSEFSDRNFSIAFKINNYLEGIPTDHPRYITINFVQ